jgi:hypothetical protein
VTTTEGAYESLREALREEFLAGVSLGREQGVKMAQHALGGVSTANQDRPLSAEIICAVLHALREQVTPHNAEERCPVDDCPAIECGGPHVRVVGERGPTIVHADDAGGPPQNAEETT